MKYFIASFVITLFVSNGYTQNSKHFFDMTGKQVYSQENVNNQIINLDVSKFSKGIYFVKVQHNEQQKILKLIKQ